MNCYVSILYGDTAYACSLAINGENLKKIDPSKPRLELFMVYIQNCTKVYIFFALKRIRFLYKIIQTKMPPESDGRSHRRFYNSDLHPIYSSCVIPTRNQFAALNAVTEASYSEHTFDNSGWKHVMYSPPTPTSPCNGLSSVFRPKSPTLDFSELVKLVMKNL